MCWTIKKCWYRVNQKVLKLGMSFMNWKEPQLFEGKNSVLKLPRFIEQQKIHRVLIVTDKGLMKLNLLSPLIKELNVYKIDCFIFDDVQPNPTIQNVEACRQM